MNYKKICPCIFIYNKKAVTWFDDLTVITDNVIELGEQYCKFGADELIVFDLSKDDDDHEDSIDILKKLARKVQAPILVGGNINRQEDIKKYLYAGAKRVILNFSKKSGSELIEEASKRFGKEKFVISLNDFDTLFKQQSLIENYSEEIMFMHKPDLNSVKDTTSMPTTIITDLSDADSLVEILMSEGVFGVSGKYVNQTTNSISGLKIKAIEAGLQFKNLKSSLDFSEFKTDKNGLIPVIVQHYKTMDVLMMAYMNKESFEQTIQTGKMTYFSRSRKCLWVKGETSGHFQYLKSMSIDCDKDTILAKVDQIGAACHTGNATCFYTPLSGEESSENNPHKIFEKVYNTIVDRKENPKEGSYTNYLFDKGLDKILKKVGEEATELVIAAKNPNPEEIKYELSDFLYHAMVLMVHRGVTWDDIIKELADR